MPFHFHWGSPYLSAAGSTKILLSFTCLNNSADWTGVNIIKIFVQVHKIGKLPKPIIFYLQVSAQRNPIESLTFYYSPITDPCCSLLKVLIISSWYGLDISFQSIESFDQHRFLWTAIRGFISEFDLYFQWRVLSAQPSPYQTQESFVGPLLVSA